MIAQAVTGEPIQQLITQGILRPLDLTHTSFPTAAAPPHLPVQGYTVEGKGCAPDLGFRVTGRAVVVRRGRSHDLHRR
jgi:CubicO group peptidase (beta-lactamase class C family)